MTKSVRRILKIVVISLGCVLLGLILLGAALRFLLVEYLAVDCSLALRYGWYEEFREYTKTNPEKKYPPMSATPGLLFLDIESLSPQFIANWGHPFCIAADSAYKRLTIEQQFASPTLAYFGYALCNENELLAFLEEYPKFIESGADFGADLPAPAGRGSFGGDQFLRLTNDLSERYGDHVGGIPIMFEIPDYSSGVPVSRHWSGSGISLTLGSTMDTIEYGSRFPMTQAVIDRIGAIKAKYAKP